MGDEGSATNVTSTTWEDVTGWMKSMFITMSQTFVGLPILRLLDYCLYVAEKSSQWSLPSHEISSEENKVFGKFELVRPLPWTLFLPTLVILRIIRAVLNMGAFIFRYPCVEPIVMVKFLQKSRRRLKAFHLKAAKSQRHTRSNNKAASPDEKSTTESVGSPTFGDTKRKFSQVSSDSESETILTKLEKCSLDDSMDDSDFNPANCSAQSSTSSSEGEEEGNISLTELEDLKKDSQDMFDDIIQSSPTTSAQPSSEREKEKNIPSTELEDIKKDTQESLTDSTGIPNAPPLDKTTSDKETEGATAMNETRVDSPELRTQIASRETTDSINGEECREGHDVTATPSETEAAPPPPPPPPPTQGVTDGEASQKRNGKSIQRPRLMGPVLDELDELLKKSTHDNAPHNQAKKNHPHKKQFYKHHAK